MTQNTTTTLLLDEIPSTMSQLLSQLAQYIQEDPTDPFNHYAYAVELSRQNPEEALKLMEDILKEFPDYLPTYYTAAALASDAELPMLAVKIIELGMDLATIQGNIKTYQELQRALANAKAELN